MITRHCIYRLSLRPSGNKPSLWCNRWGQGLWALSRVLDNCQTDFAVASVTSIASLLRSSRKRLRVNAGPWACSRDHAVSCHTFWCPSSPWVPVRADRRHKRPWPTGEMKDAPDSLDLNACSKKVKCCQNSVSFITHTFSRIIKIHSVCFI